MEKEEEKMVETKASEKSRLPFAFNEKGKFISPLCLSEENAKFYQKMLGKRLRTLIV